MKLKTLILSIGVMMTGMAALASTQATLANNVRIAVGGIRTVFFPQAYVESLSITAEGSDATIQVWLNGTPKGSFYMGVRAGLSTFSFPIGETTGSLEFRSTKGSAVMIHQVRGFGLTGPIEIGPRPTFNRFGGNENLVQRAGYLIQVLNGLKPQANHGIIGSYILPMRKSAAELYALATATTEPNRKVREAMCELLSRIYDAEAYINSNLETDTAFDGTVDILTMKETLRAMLR
jgi:hypothetical protein